DPAGTAMREIRQRDGCGCHGIAPWRRCEILRLKGAAAARTTAHHLLEDVINSAKAAAARTARAPPLGSEGEGFKLDIGPACAEAASAKAATRMHAFESLEARLALGVNFAGIKLLALGFVAQNFVGGIHLREFLRGFGIVLVGVGVVLLGKLSKR